MRQGRLQLLDAGVQIFDSLPVEESELIHVAEVKVGVGEDALSHVVELMAMMRPRTMVAIWTKKSRQELAAWWAGWTSSMEVGSSGVLRGSGEFSGVGGTGSGWGMNLVAKSVSRIPHPCDEAVQSPYILYTLLSGHSLHQRGVLDGLDGEECAGSASGVRDTSQPRRGVERFVPGVRDHAADRLSVAAAFSTTGRDGDGGAEPASARESAADLGGGGAADRTVAARASGLGRTQAGGVAGAA